MKLLFTSVGRRVELIQHFKQSAEELNIELEIFGADIVDTAPALFFCDHKVIVPKISSDNYIPALKEICKNNDIDALIPTIDTDLLLLSKVKNEFGKTRVIISHTDKITLCRDKTLTADYFNSLGLKSPRPVDNYMDYKDVFPAFIKPKDGSSSINAYKVNSFEELESYSHRVPDYIVQKYAEGVEYTVDAFCDFDGNPIFITPRIRISVRAGEVLKTQIDNNEQIINEMKVIIDDYKPCGAITIQLIRNTVTEENNYIEINPRFGGGAPLSMMAGANSAKALLQLLKGENVSYTPNAAENGAIFSRFDQSIRVK